MSEKIAVITGAGGTLCSAMAKDLAIQGYKVALLGRTIDKLKVVEEEIKSAGGFAISVVADVSSEASITKAKEIIEEKLGTCSLLVNGAGGNQNEALPKEKLNEK